MLHCSLSVIFTFVSLKMQYAYTPTENSHLLTLFFNPVSHLECAHPGRVLHLLPQKNPDEPEPLESVGFKGYVRQGFMSHLKGSLKYGPSALSLYPFLPLLKKWDSTEWVAIEQSPPPLLTPFSSSAHLECTHPQIPVFLTTPTTKSR